MNENEQTADATDAADDDYGWGEHFAELAAAEDRVTLHPDGIEVRLLTPITVAGDEVTALRLSEPTTKDLRVLDRVKGNVAGAVEVLVKCAGISQLDAERLKARDFALIGKVLTCFFGESPKTGGT